MVQVVDAANQLKAKVLHLGKESKDQDDQASLRRATGSSLHVPTSE